jgi:competence protein ComEC
VLYPSTIPAVALAAGIALGIVCPTSPFVATILLTAAWVAACTAFRLRRDRLFVLTICLGFAMGGELLGSRANEDALHAPIGAMFDANLRPGEYDVFGTIDGTLRTDATRGASGVSLKVDSTSVRFEGIAESTNGGVSVGVGGDLASAPVEEWREGRRVRLQASLRRPAKYLDPGVPDSERDFAWNGATLVGSVKSPRLIEVIGNGTWMHELFASMRWGIRYSVDRSIAHWSERSAAVVTAILIGDRAGLDADMQRQLQEAGTYHVIAISGGNIAILAAVCVSVLRWGRVRPRGSAAILILVLVTYALLVGGAGGASVGRATLMAVIYFSGQLVDQRSKAGNVAACTAAALFCVVPLEVVDASFALTFGATLGLIVGMPMLTRPDWLPAWMFSVLALLAASVCAEIALLPVSAFVFSRVTAAGLLLNFAAIPLMTVVQIGGMIAIALDHVNSAAALWAGYVVHLGVRGLFASASLVEFAPGVTRRVPPPSLLLICAYYVSLIGALSWRGRRRLITASVTCLCGWLMITTVTWPHPTGTTRSLRVAFLDVGQGDAAVVQFPDGRTLTIDAGGIAGTAFDIGGRVVSPSMWALGIRQLEYMSISHSDPDHIGGAASVLRDFHVREVWEGVPVPHNEPTRALRAVADRTGARWRSIRANDRFTFGDVDLLVHHPPAPDWERQKVRNNDSEVLELRYGDVSFVFTGDIGREVEQDIAVRFEPAHIRVLKVPHHGSGTSSSEAFLQALHPSIAVISAGRGNPFHHPVPLVLARYAAIGAAIFRTDQDGAVMIDTDGRAVHVKTFTGRTMNLPTETH